MYIRTCKSGIPDIYSRKYISGNVYQEIYIRKNVDGAMPLKTKQSDSIIHQLERGEWKHVDPAGCHHVSKAVVMTCCLF